MKVVTVRSKIEGIAELWKSRLSVSVGAAQSISWANRQSEEIYNPLLALDVATATPDDIATITGSRYWIDNPPQCSDCDRRVPAVAEFSLFSEYGDEEFLRLCADCLQEALDGVKAVQPTTCQHCRHWKRIPPYHRDDTVKLFGICASPKFVDEYPEGAPPDNYTSDMLRYFGSYDYPGIFSTGQDFGCIHWEAKDIGELT